jgi:hypothetical protein
MGGILGEAAYTRAAREPQYLSWNKPSRTSRTRVTLACCLALEG